MVLKNYNLEDKKSIRLIWYLWY